MWTSNRIRERQFRVALDARERRRIRDDSGFPRGTLGCDLHAISIDPTQPFPREAEPKPERSARSPELVREKGCDIGFAQDPDGDRLAVIDENGAVLDNDDVLALAVEAALERLPGDVVVNLTTSTVIDDIARGTWPQGLPHPGRRSECRRDDPGGERRDRRRRLERRHYLPGRPPLPRQLQRHGDVPRPHGEHRAKTISQLAARLPRYYRRIGKVAFEHGSWAR